MNYKWESERDAMVCGRKDWWLDWASSKHLNGVSLWTSLSNDFRDIPIFMIFRHWSSFYFPIIGVCLRLSIVWFSFPWELFTREQSHASKLWHFWKSLFRRGQKTDLFKLKVDITNGNNIKLCRNKQSCSFLFLQCRKPKCETKI